MEYNQSPLIGPIGPLTWYNAPGITPDSRTTPAQDGGKFNFNSDAELLGTFTLPDPPGLGPPTPDGGARLPVGQPVFFTDPNGNLRNLIQRAKTAGRTTITFAVADALNVITERNPEMLQTTPGGMLNFNYLVNPKEIIGSYHAGLQLNNDNDWDPDGSGPLTATAARFPATDSANCGPFPVGLGNNTTGAFSPHLLLIVFPNRASVGAGRTRLACAMRLRRRK